jgi:hypothetical protein
MVTINHSGRKLGEDDLRDFEHDLGARLPDAYRAFLLRNNGGTPWPDMIRIEGLPTRVTNIQMFFGLHQSDEQYNLDWNLRTFAERAPLNSIPIARDSFDSLFCMTLKGDARGRITFVDSLQEGRPRYEIADSIDGLLEKLG